MAYLMEEAARRRVKVIVLDRPNPIAAAGVRGPMLDPDLKSFVAYFPMPVQHAMTLGELAAMFNAENRIGADLHRGEGPRLAPRHLVRRDGPRLDQPLAQPAHARRRHPLSRCRADRADQRQRRPRHVHAVRPRRRAVDRQQGTRRAPRAPRNSRRGLRARAFHADVRQACRQTLPRRAHHADRPLGAGCSPHGHRACGRPAPSPSPDVQSARHAGAARIAHAA